MNMNDVALTLVTFFVFLGLAMILFSEITFRMKRVRMRQRLSSVAVHLGDRQSRVNTAAIASRLAVWGDVFIDLALKEGIWPRQISSLRVIGNTLAGMLAVMAAFTYGIGVPWWMGAIAATGALFGVPFMLVRKDQQEQCARFEGNLADTIDMMIRMLRAGLPVTVAVGRVGREAQEPAAAIYREANEWLEMGLPLSQAMRKVAQRIKVKDFDFFAAALAIQSTVGGNLTETLESLSGIIRERSVSMLKARAVTSQARMTSNVILGILPGLTVMMLLLRPEYILPLVDGSNGYGLFSFIALSYVLAFFTIRQLVSRVKIGT